jgi:hypothetical protein
MEPLLFFVLLRVGFKSNFPQFIASLGRRPLRLRQGGSGALFFYMPRLPKSTARQIKVRPLLRPLRAGSASPLRPSRQFLVGWARASARTARFRLAVVCVRTSPRPFSIIFRPNCSPPFPFRKRGFRFFFSGENNAAAAISAPLNSARPPTLGGACGKYPGAIF